MKLKYPRKVRTRGAMYIKHNTETHLRNHFCCGKAVLGNIFLCVCLRVLERRWVSVRGHVHECV
jgi:hypothetical protein